MYASGLSKNEEILTDIDLGIEVENSAKIIRKIEMFQLVEKEIKEEYETRYEYS